MVSRIKWIPLAMVFLRKKENILHLLKAGADISICNNDGLTPKQYALQRGDNLVVQIIDEWEVQSKESNRNVTFAGEEGVPLEQDIPAS